MLERAIILAVLVLALPARADFTSELAGVGPGLRVTLRDGYPRSIDPYSGTTTFGLELENLGAEREVELVAGGDISARRLLRLPAHERMRVFYYAPIRMGSNTLTVIDKATGAARELHIGASVESNLQLGRLGTLSTAFNVDTPWSMAGSLDSHFPDDWRGLAGVHAIVVEHEHLLARRALWPVLHDWMVMGGQLAVLSTPEQLATPVPVDLPAAFISPVKETWFGLSQRVGLGVITRVHPEKLVQVSTAFRDNVCADEKCGFVMDAGSVRPDAIAEEAVKRMEGAIHRPVQALFAVLACFALVVGPFGHTYFVRRRRQPLRYVAFAAGTAVSFSAAAITADLLGNGVETKASVRALLLIDQRADRELGVEDMVLYEPTGLGFDLQPLAAAQLFTPSQNWRESLDSLQFEPAGKRLRVRQAVPPREPRSLGARWLSEASGRLVTAAEGGGLAVENQLGRDLSSLVIWHEGALYTLGALKRGQRAQAVPVAASMPDVEPRVPSSLITNVYRNLVGDVLSGKRGQNRYLAQATWNAELSGITTSPLELAQPAELLIAGVY